MSSPLIEWFLAVLAAAWNVLLESSSFVLLGFLVAGLLKGFLPDNFVSSHLGEKGVWPVLKAAALGVPLPLCSCGVLPAAAGLRKQGAGKGAVTSFLISTPETGVDSIALSWALLDPIMTLVRPVAAFTTAVAAGIAVSFAGDEKAQENNGSDKTGTSCDSGCGCSHKPAAMHGSAASRLRRGMDFAFGDLLKDIGLWLLGGILLAGIISVSLSPEMVSRMLTNQYAEMALMLVLSVPMYVCATASTPIAAALAMKGISPGAALVFLLAGPATNAAAVSVISRLLGKKATMIYVGMIVLMSFLAGLTVNAIYLQFGINTSGWLQGSVQEKSNPVDVASALLLLILIGRALVPAQKPTDSCCH